MLSKKHQKQSSRSKKKIKEKILSPQALQLTKTKLKNEQPTQKNKKMQPKSYSKIHSLSNKNSLFNSLQQLPLAKLQKRKAQKLKKAKKKSVVNEEDSTASRDFKHHLMQYNTPNGQYFGSRVSSVDRNHQRHAFSKDKKGRSLKKKVSLEKKIKDYRRMSSKHKSESESMASDFSDKELHRLTKMQSIEKRMLMEEIMSLEEKRLHIKAQR